MNDAILAAVSGGLVTTGLLWTIAGLGGPQLLPVPRLHRIGRRINVRREKVILAVIALAAALVTFAVTRWPVAALGIAVAVIAVPRLLSGRAVRHRIARLEALETWTRQLSDTLTTGAGIEQALIASADDPPPAIASEIAALRQRLEFRTPTEDALRTFADDIDHPVGDMICASLIIASTVRSRGLRDVLNALAATVARDVAMQREIDAERAMHRTTAAWVVVALGLYTVYAMLNRDYVAPFGSPVGQGVLAVVVLLYGGTLGWLHRLASPPQLSRFLPPDGGRR